MRAGRFVPASARAEKRDEKPEFPVLATFIVLLAALSPLSMIHVKDLPQ